MHVAILVDYRQWIAGWSHFTSAGTVVTGGGGAQDPCIERGIGGEIVLRQIINPIANGPIGWVIEQIDRKPDRLTLPPPVKLVGKIVVI